jgi:hypothetical protein
MSIRSQNAHKVIEVTGAPGSGKTTFIKKEFENKEILAGGVPLSCGIGMKIFYSLFLCVYAVVTKSITPKQFLWLVKKSAKYNETLIVRLNALRNSTMKFGTHFFLPNNDHKLIDEGVSHIPFILELSDEDVDTFIRLFRRQLDKVTIVFITTPMKEVLMKRIATRGHKRVRQTNDTEGFVNKNIRIAEYYKKRLSMAGFDIDVR